MTLQEQLRKLTTGGPGVTHIASETLFEDCAQKLDDDWKDSQALMKLLADEKHKVAALEARCRELEANHRRIRHTVDCHVPIGEIRDVLLEMVDQCLPAETPVEPTHEHDWIPVDVVGDDGVIFECSKCKEREAGLTSPYPPGECPQANRGGQP